jgi:hypothetical protein
MADLIFLRHSLPQKEKKALIIAYQKAVAPFVKTGFLIFKWKLCSVGLSMGARAAPPSRTSARAGG